VDLCYPGCGDFSYNDVFADMIMTYTPCSTDDCTVTVVDASIVCEPGCSIHGSSNRQRFLEDSSFQSSAILFEIMSVTPLNEQVVLANLNSNITNANEGLETGGALFRVSGEYTAGTLLPTASPTYTMPGRVSTLAIPLYRLFVSIFVLTEIFISAQRGANHPKATENRNRQRRNLVRRRMGRMANNPRVPQRVRAHRALSQRVLMPRRTRIRRPTLNLIK
jgi:hypothetical protein